MSTKPNFFTKAKIELLGKDPSMASLVMRLNLKEEKGIETAWTDGRTFGVDREWFLGLNPQVRLTVLAEAALHCALGHPFRKENRNQLKWDIASDVVTYPLLKKMGYSMPSSVVLPDDLSFLYDRQMNAEGVYNKLPDIPEPPVNPMFVQSRSPEENPSGSNGDSELGDGDQKTVQELAQEWEDSVRQLFVSNKLQGIDSAELERLFKASHPKGDWRNMLHSFTNKISYQEYQWKRPNKRYVHMGQYLPRLRNPSVGTLMILVDTSASIDEDLLSQSFAEINCIKQSVNFEEIIVLYVDAKVCHVERFSKHDRVLFSPKGGGGTNFKPGFKWIKDNNIDPGCCLYFTDLECSSYPETPSFPVLWITENETSGKKPPFGSVLNIMG